MPGGFKRMGERFRQCCGVSEHEYYGQDWKPTSNARNEAMMKEARRCAQHVKALHKHVSTLDVAVDGTLTNFTRVMAAPLPHAYDEVASGSAAPVDTVQRPVGAFVSLEAIAAAKEEMRQTLVTEVLLPLQQWLAAYRMIKERNRRCEALRLDLDSERRATLRLHDKYVRQQSNSRPGTEKTLMKEQNTQDRMTRLAQQYAEVEADVFNGLLALIRDSAALRDYMAAAVAAVQRCFSTTHHAFDLRKPVPLPVLPAPATPKLHVVPPNPMLAMDTMGAVRTPVDAAPAGAPAVGVLPTSATMPMAASPAAAPPPAWYSEAKQNARPPVYGEDSDEEQQAESAAVYIGGPGSPLKQNPAHYNSAASSPRPPGTPGQQYAYAAAPQQQRQAMPA